MNWAIKIISKTLMTKISQISWGVTTMAFTVYRYLIKNNTQIKNVFLINSVYYQFYVLSTLKNFTSLDLFFTVS